MMSPRRSQLEIRLNILSAVRDGVDKPTRIMYAANMSWKPVQRILSHLVEQGLLEVRMNTESRQSKKRYVLTDKGANVIDYFEKAKEILPFEEVYAGD
jgi:predicted transcriptional regulator